MSFANRRQFLCLSAAFGTAWRFDFAERLMHSAMGEERSSIGFGSLKLAKRTAWALGSDVSITALHRDSRVAAAAIDDAFDELELVEQLMSIYRPESQLRQLNRHGLLDRPHAHFVRVLRFAQRLSKRTDGAFDISVQPYWDLYSAAAEQHALPDEEQLQQASACVDWKQIEVKDQRVRLGRAGMSITLNGIAQGFAADQAAAALRARGVVHALINTGEINTLGKNGEGEAWRIGIQHPRQKDAYVSLAKLAGRCLATSGDYESSFSADYRHNHLIDPRTGRSPTELASVSIAAPTAMHADALSTALYILGPERGMKLVTDASQTDALLVLKNGRTLKTDGFPSIG